MEWVSDSVVWSVVGKSLKRALSGLYPWKYRLVKPVVLVAPVRTWCRRVRQTQVIIVLMLFIRDMKITKLIS